ncbi:pirin family protein [Ancylomarina longa]|uniref:Pirin family protein n=1 Tax=Ancylomarina longa TaxID=2487017 RepID=A0A434AF70_9BACT|nr:pirin-like bicupin family protein [Ancylomarina longa]RUT73061.1 pirin family protein [Ancylomarina longa]
MKRIYHAADSRGSSKLDWLDSKHSFSFADYYCPERISFGTLRVLNDDIVKPGMGFGTHPHQDMEIISILLEGAMVHKDSSGHEEILKGNDVQVMSAGTGIMHSEFNASAVDEVHFLQIWIFPDKKGLAPRYDQKTFDDLGMDNSFQLLVAPMNSNNNALKINQNAFVSRARLQKDEFLDYQQNISDNGTYIFVLEGEVVVGEQLLQKKDGFGIFWDAKFKVECTEDAQLIFLEIPMC